MLITIRLDIKIPGFPMFIYQFAKNIELYKNNDYLNDDLFYLYNFKNYTY